jgi:hypothetical protein
MAIGTFLGENWTHSALEEVGGSLGLRFTAEHENAQADGDGQEGYVRLHMSAAGVGS